MVLGIGSRMLIQFRQWGMDKDIKIIRIDADAEEPGRLHKPAIALIGDAKPVLQRLLEVLPAHNAKRASRTAEMEGRQAAWRKRLGRDRAADRLPRRHPRRAAGGRHPGRRGHADGLRRPPGVPGLQAAHLPVAGLPGQSRLGLCHRARRAGRPPRRAGGVDLRRRRLHVHRKRDGDRGPPPHPAHHHRVQRWRLRQRPPHPGGKVRQPADRQRSCQSGFRANSPKASAPRANGRAARRCFAPRCGGPSPAATARP